jgi:ribosomal protein S18 acetylase RimI-like enzyme
MEERTLDIGGEEYQMTEFRGDDREWMEDGLEESFRRSIPPGFEVPSSMVRELAVGEADKLIDDPKVQSEIIVLRKGDRRAGILWMATSKHQYSGELRGWVLQLQVSREFRGRGVGKALMSLAEEWTSERGMSRIGLNVGVGNEEAIRLYQSAGLGIEGYNMGKRIQ